MKTYTHLWQYFARFFLEWEIFETTFAGNIKLHILGPVHFSLPECRAVCEIMQKNAVEPDKPQMTI